MDLWQNTNEYLPLFNLVLSTADQDRIFRVWKGRDCKAGSCRIESERFSKAYFKIGKLAHVFDGDWTSPNHLINLPLGSLVGRWIFEKEVEEE